MRTEGFKIPKRQPGSYWSENIFCPLANHEDSSASFGYNFKYDRFYCFGCRQSGKAVEFLAGVRNVSRISIADDILNRIGDDTQEIELVNESDEIKKILISLSLRCQNIIKKFKDDPFILEILKKPMIWIDGYLLVNVPKNYICIEELKIRVDKTKEILDEIEEL
jgi:hypothetical protein